MLLSRRLAGAALLLAPGLALAQAEGRDYGFHHQGGMMMGWGGWFLGPLMMLLFLALAAGAIVLVVRAVSGGGTAKGGDGDRALAILRERFARGEIDEAEFEARRQRLEG